MASDRHANFTPEETISLINARLKEEPNLTFRAKIFKRQRVTGILDHVATVGGVMPTHLANPEQWIPELCGGGSFVMTVYSLDQPTVMIGGQLPYSHRALERDVNMSVTSKPSWEGPPVLEFPKATDMLGIPEAFSTSVVPGNFPGGPGTSLPHTQAPQLTVPGQGGSGPSFSISNHESVWLKQMEDRFAQREREMLQAEQKMRAEADAQKMALREERLRNEFDAKQRELENQIKAAAAANAARPADGSGLKEIITGLAPVVMQILKGQDDMKLAALKAQQDAAQQTQLLLVKLMDKPAIGPEVQMMIELVKSRGNENKESLEAMSIINKSALNMLHSVADMQLGGQPENPVMAAIKEGIKALRVAQSGATRRPAAPQYPQPQPMPAGYEQQALRAPPAGAQAQGPQVPAAPVQAMAQPQGAFAGLPPAQPPQAQLTLVQKIVAMIQTYQPPDEVAKAFLLNLREPSVMQAMQASGMDTDVLIQNLLGEWMTARPENIAYLNALKDSVERLGIEAGIFTEDDVEAQNGAVGAEVAADAMDEGEEDAEYDEE